jgi:N-acetylglutamate synthase/N-acetylornithine aminotransferase
MKFATYLAASRVGIASNIKVAADLATSVTMELTHDYVEENGAD